MKKLIIFLLFGFLLASCSNFDSTTEPIANNSQKRIIKMPSHSKTAVEETFSTSKEINGIVGGKIDFNFSYTSDAGTPVNIYGTLTIPAGAFQYTTTIRLDLNTDEAVIDCYPTPTTFDKPLLLDMTHEGLNLDGVDNSADFYYIKTDSNFESLNKNNKVIQYSNDKLEVKGAKLPHFTRFGWTT